jgi:hypothetical protein
MVFPVSCFKKKIETTQQLEMLRISDDGRKGMNKKKKKYTDLNC